MTSTSNWAIFHAGLDSMQPYTRRGMYPTQCPCLLDADCCLQSDVVSTLGLQVIRGRKIFTLYPPTDAPFLHQTEFRSAQYRAQAGGGGGEGDAATTFDVVPLPDGEIGCTRPWIPIDPDACVAPPELN